MGGLSQFNAQVAVPMLVLAANTFNAHPLVLSAQAYIWFIIYGGRFVSG